MGRKPKLVTKPKLSITLDPGQPARIDAVLGPDETRSEFIRRAVEAALRKAEKRREG